MSAEELRAKIREIPDFPKPGILFYDITTLLKDAGRVPRGDRPDARAVRDEQIDIVVGMESRGFIFSAPMAYQLDAGLVPGAQARQAAGRDASRSSTRSSTARTRSRSIATRSSPGRRSSSSTTCWRPAARSRARSSWSSASRARSSGLAFLVELEFLKGRDRLDGRRVTSVIQY